uniref:NAD(P)H-dependent oxidoreductase n=1 Tax=uncultured Erythrobacter sp. TaxID=263913 RepID=UPI00261714FF|nr:NAD(P)H-dependent oxidoreductase [uncultured Erythrobacter sp.]
MSEAPTFLVIWHSRTGASKAMAEAVAEAGGARLVRASDVTADMLLSASGYVFICPENLGALSGEMKEMFDRTYYQALEKIEGRPFVSIIAAGSDGEGAQRQLERIVTGWRLKRVMPRKIVNFSAQRAKDILAEKTVEQGVLQECREIGIGLSEGISLGVF